MDVQTLIDGLKPQMGVGWTKLLFKEFLKDYMKELRAFLKKERQRHTVYPASKHTLRAFRTTPPSEVKVVIIGQDPYPHDAANGLAFSCHQDRIEQVPASLQNIFQELEDDMGFSGPSQNPDLTRWAEQGVLLLNTYLTVRAGEPGSHRGYGWRTFTSKVIEMLGDPDTRPKVFILWGNHAQSFKGLISPFDHHIIESYHPSPMSAHRGFFGSQPFSRTNEYLVEDGYEPIDWTGSGT